MGRYMSSKTGRKYADEVVSTAVLAGAGAYLASGSDFFSTLKESLYHARHAGRTVLDAVRGGPEGMRAARNLEDALKIVTKASETNVDAKETLETYIFQRKGLVGELAKIYRENETVSDVAGRLELQLSGFLRNYFELGNVAKGKTWKKIDNAIMKIYGQDPVKAREKSGNLARFYKEVREFYDAREKNEHTVKEFCDHLKKIQTDSVAQNKRFNELFPNVIARVKEGYETEDLLVGANRHKGTIINGAKGVGSEVESFRNDVDRTYTEVGREMPIEPYHETNWVDVTVNPLTIGLASALVVKGASRFLGLGNVVNKVVAAPVVYPVKGAISGIRKVGQKIKRGLNSKTGGDDVRG